MNKNKSVLSGWGNFPTTNSYLFRPERLQDLKFEKSPRIARGLGRSYGDAAINTERSVYLMERFNCFIAFDEEKGILKAEAGVNLEDILNVFVPRGWFLPVTPGTKFVTLGGCLAADVHGKNHHVSGTFSRFVHEIGLLLSDGTKKICSRTQNKELFFATIGGMGLTGIITEISLQLIRIETAYMNVRHYAAKNLESTLEALEDRTREDHYSVAWLDCLSTGANTGRSIMMNGHHARISELTTYEKPLIVKPRKQLSIPCTCPSWLLNSWSIQSFNSLYYKMQERKKESFIVDYDRYFYPLDGAGNWNRLYGKNGFIQYQFVLPTQETGKGMLRILEAIKSEGRNPFLAVLKRFGPANESYLSFPQEGYTLALDFPIKDKGLFPFLDKLDEMVLEHGGRVYLAKDARMKPALLKPMYPRLTEWKKIKDLVDPRHCFSSDLSRRLELTR